MKKFTTLLALGTLAFSGFVAPVSAQNFDVITSSATCRCAVIPGVETLAFTSLAADPITDFVVVTLNQPGKVSAPRPVTINNGVIQGIEIDGFKVWVNGQPMSINYAGLNTNQRSLPIQLRIVNQLGQKYDITKDSKIELEYAPVAGNVVVAENNLSLQLGAIAKQKVVEGLAGDATCPTIQDYVISTGGNVFTAGVSEPLSMLSPNGTLNLSLNGVSSTKAVAAGIGSNIGGYSEVPWWPTLKSSDSIGVAALPNSTFKDNAGNSLCVQPMKTLKFYGAPASTPDTTAPTVVKFGISGANKIFKASGTGTVTVIPDFYALMSEPVDAGSTFWATLEKGTVWVRFSVDPSNPSQMIGKSYFGKRWNPSHIGVINVKNILMSDVKDLAGNKLDQLTGFQQAISGNNISTGAPSMVVALNNFSSTLKALR